MECQNTKNLLKINYKKRVGTVVVIVEGESDEFRLLKHIFTKIFNYDLVTLRRDNEPYFELKNNDNTLIIVNTSSSSLKSINEEDYKIRLRNLLKDKYNKNLKNVPIYILWDRDRESGGKTYIESALKTYTSALDNEYDMNGLLLLSYPCYECYNLSNFHQRYYLKTYKISEECKKEFNKSKFTIDNIDEKSILLAIQNMHKRFVKYGIFEYDPALFLNNNKKIFRKEEECYRDNKYYDALSLISIMLIDLGLID